MCKCQTGKHPRTFIFTCNLFPSLIRFLHCTILVSVRSVVYRRPHSVNSIQRASLHGLADVDIKKLKYRNPLILKSSIWFLSRNIRAGLNKKVGGRSVCKSGVSPMLTLKTKIYIYIGKYIYIYIYIYQ